MAAGNKKGTYGEIGPYASLGIQFAVTILLFLGGGWWLDGKLGTTPVFILLGTLFGAVGAFYKLYRTLMDLDKKRKGDNAS